jgi:hypothetical protein
MLDSIFTLFQRIDNWMTRYLARKARGKLTVNDLQLAKDMLKYKCLIGFTDDYVESLRRLDTYLGLNTWSKPSMGLECIERLVKRKANKNEHEKLGQEEWDALAKANSIDIELFEFARTLYDDQDKMLQNRTSITWNYRRDEREWKIP